MAVLNYEGLAFYDQELKQFLLQNYATDTKATIAYNIAQEAKAMIVAKNIIPLTSEEIDSIFEESEEIEQGS